MKININDNSVNFDELKDKIQKAFPQYEHIVRKNFFGPFLVIKQSNTVGVAVQVRKNVITIYGYIPSILIQMLFGGLLLYVFIRSKLNAMETEIGEFVKQNCATKISN